MRPGTPGRRPALWLWLALGAGSVTLAGLGLHPQILLIDLVTLGLFTAARALALTAWHRTLWRSIRAAGALTGRCVLVVGTMAGVGLLGAAVQLVPLYELATESSRGGGLTYAQASAGGVMLVDLMTMLLPYGFRADPAVQWMRYPYWESTVYVGVAGLLLAILGLLFGRRRIVLPVGAVGALGLLLAMAQHAPVDLYVWLWSLPGFSSMRAPVRYTLLFELALAVLAAAGLDRLRAGAAPRGARIAALALLSALLALLAGAVWLRAGSLQIPATGASGHRADVPDAAARPTGAYGRGGTRAVSSARLTWGIRGRRWRSSRALGRSFRCRMGVAWARVPPGWHASSRRSASPNC